MFFGTQNYANDTQNVGFKTQKIGLMAHSFFLSWHIKPAFWVTFFSIWNTLGIKMQDY